MQQWLCYLQALTYNQWSFSLVTRLLHSALELQRYDLRRAPQLTLGVKALKKYKNIYECMLLTTNFSVANSVFVGLSKHLRGSQFSG